MKNRGQAAMEFLMTYGWALLVVLIAIGALAFFGVLNPSRFLPTQCFLGPGLACEDFKVVKGTTGDEDRIFIQVRNGMGKDFEYFYIYVDKKSATGDEVCGGFLGIVGHPLSGVPFKDGEVKPLRAYLPPPILSLGLNCNLGQQNCCSDLAFYIGTTQACNLVCVGSTPIPPTGSKFSQDIVIVYKEKESQILHQRVGKLTTQVE